jgi:hypothetical protein
VAAALPDEAGGTAAWEDGMSGHSRLGGFMRDSVTLESPIIEVRALEGSEFAGAAFKPAEFAPEGVEVEASETANAAFEVPAPEV